MAAERELEKARPEYGAYQSPELRNQAWLALILDFLKGLSFRRAITFSAMAVFGWMAYQYLKAGFVAESLGSLLLVFAVWLIGFWPERKTGAKNTQEISPNPATQLGDEPDGKAEARRPP